MKLTINTLSKTYANGVHALKDVSLTLNNGMFGSSGTKRRRQIFADANNCNLTGGRPGIYFP